MDFNFYIPKNVSTRFEIIRGVGIREIVYVGIAVIIGVVIAIIINSTTGNILASSACVAILGGGTFVFNMKDKNNQSVITFIKDMIRFYNSQKFFKYEVKGETYGINNYESEKY